MKRIQFIIIVLLTIVGNATAFEHHIVKSLECDCTFEAGCNVQENNGSGNVEISLTSPDGHHFFAFQLFIVFNEGIAPIPDEEEDYGEYILVPSDRFGDTDKKKAKYGIQIAKKDNGYQIVCLNQKGDSILGSEGLLLTIPVKNVPSGQEIIGQISGIEFTTMEGNAIHFETEMITDIINDSVVINKASGKTYNLNGQETNDNSKGLLIRNKKKILNK